MHSTTNHRLRRLACAAILAGPATLIGSLHAQGTPFGMIPQEITNGDITLKYNGDPAVGGLRLLSIGDAAESEVFEFEPVEIFRLYVRDVNTTIASPFPDPGPDCSPSLICIGPTQLDPASGSVTRVGGNSWFRITWDDSTSPLLPPTETIDVSFSARILPGSKEVETKIDVDLNGSSAFTLFGVDSPRVRLLEMQGSAAADQRIATPAYIGSIVHDPMENGGGAGYHPGILSMQWWAYYDENPATSDALFYFASSDPEGYKKGFFVRTVDPQAQRRSLEYIHQWFPENNLTTTTYSSPYTCNLGVLRGDWYDAARHYREWILGSGSDWVALGPMETNPTFSSVIRDARMLGTSLVPPCPTAFGCNGKNHNHFQYMNTDLTDLKNYFIGTSHPMPSRVKFWDFKSFGAQMGDWFPVRQQFLAAADDPEIHLLPYFLPLVYSQNASTYNAPYVPGYQTASVEDYLVMNPDGSFDVLVKSGCVGPTVTCDPGAVETKLPAQLCMATDFAADYFEHVVNMMNTEHPGELGSVTGNYLDVYYAIAASCYDSTHTHGLLGGGKWYTEAKRDLLLDTKAFMQDPLGGDVPGYGYAMEAFNESLVGAGEWGAHDIATTVISPPVSFAAPLFETVYHEYGHVTSHAAQLKGAADHLLTDPEIMMVQRQVFAGRIAMGLAPATGAVFDDDPLAVDLAKVEFAKTAQMIKNHMDVLKLDTVRHWTVFGQLLRAPETDSPTVSFESSCLPIFQTADLPLSYDQPQVYAAVFGRAEEDSIGVIVMNWTHPDDDQICAEVTSGPNQSVLIEIDWEEYGIPAGASYKISQIDETGTTVVQDFPFTIPAGPSLLFSNVNASGAEFFYIEKN